MTRVAVDRLPGLLGHELRNPLASAMTGVMLAREMVDADDARAPVLDGVLQDLQRLVDLTDGWLEVAQRGRCAVGGFELGELVRQVAARHGADMVACEEHAIDGNRALLERVFDNLCENARRAGAGRIRIAVQAQGEDVAVHVEDDGAGIAPADLGHIFTAGWSKRGGAGLGLHAVAATVTAHGGHVRCQPLARGTRFTVSLPLALAERVARA